MHEFIFMTSWLLFNFTFKTKCMKKLIIISLVFMLGCAKEEILPQEDFGIISVGGHTDYIPKRPYTVSTDSGYTRVEYDAFIGQYKLEVAIIYNTYYPNKTKVLYKQDNQPAVFSNCGYIYNKDTCMGGNFIITKTKDKIYISGSTTMLQTNLTSGGTPHLTILKNLVLKKD